MQNAPKGSIRTKVKMIIFILALHLTLYTLHGICGGPGTTGAAFLKLGAGSRPVAMGEAFVAAADDINALYWNPAGLALADGKQVSFVHTEWFQSIRYEYLAYCQQALGGTIGAGITYLYIDGIGRSSAKFRVYSGKRPCCCCRVFKVPFREACCRGVGKIHKPAA